LSIEFPSATLFLCVLAARKELAMNDKEKRESYIAMCKCCLLAEGMKTCPFCLFNIGLAVQVELLEPEAMPIRISLAAFAMAE